MFVNVFHCLLQYVLKGKRLREEDEEDVDLDLQHLKPAAKVVIVEVVETRRRKIFTIRIYTILT